MVSVPCPASRHKNEQYGGCFSVAVDADNDDEDSKTMKGGLLCVAVLCAAAMLGQVQAAPTDVSANQLVNRLKELLRHRQQDGEKKVSTVFTLI